jgi:hypothetical protein
VLEVLEQGKAYMRPRIIDDMSTGSGFLRAYITTHRRRGRDLAGCQP